MSTETPVRKRRVKAATRHAAAIGSAVAVAAVALLGTVIWMFLSHREQSAADLAAAQAARAAELAAPIGSAIAAEQLKLQAAADDPELPAVIAAGDAATREAKAAALAGGLAHLLKLRLLPADVRDTDDAPPVPFTYASLDMVIRARADTGPVPAEVHLPGQPAQHIAMVRAVKDSAGAIVGFLHGAYSLELLDQALAAVDAGGAYLELRQPVPKGEPVVVARAGGTAPPAGIAAAQNPVPGTAWSLAYFGIPEGVPAVAPAPAPAAEAVAAADGGGLLLPLGGGALLLLLAGGGYVLWRRQADSLAGEPVVYQGAVRAIMEGAHPGLEKLVPGLPSSTARAPLELSAADELEGDDVTAIHRPPPARVAPSAATTAAATGDTETFFFDQEPVTADAESPAAVTPAAIFRAYDIRGVVDETLTVDGVYALGRAIGSEAYERGQQGVIVARDGRLSSPELAEALVNGLRDTGRDVIDVGMVPSPVLYFATHYLDTASGVMVTGSHNPKEWNGLKVVLAGETLSGDTIKALRSRIERRDFANGGGSLQAAEIIPEYIRRVTEDIPVALGNALKIVVDCGNSVPAAVAPQLLRALGHDVVELYCEIDGNFPNHHPDPSQPENLTDLIEMVKLEDADLGLAFDGDGDRLGVVDGEGNVLWPDRQMMLFARDVLSRNAGAQIIFDVKCTRHLADVIKAAGGQPLMWKTGHSLIKQKMRETGALLAGEMSGHIFFKERWYGFDDAMYAAARLTEILVTAGKSPAEVFRELPGGVATPELRIDLPEAEHAGFMRRLAEGAKFGDARVTTLDGLRVDFADGWGLVRPSNTTPVLIARFEGDDDKALQRIRKQFRELAQSASPGLDVPF